MIKNILVGVMVLVVVIGVVAWSGAKDNKLMVKWTGCEDTYKLTALPFNEHMKACMNK